METKIPSEEIDSEYEAESPEATYRQSAVNGLAVFGFIALIAVGVWGAVYASRYVPTIADRLGTAAVYVGSLFVPAKAPNLSVVGTTTSTGNIYFGNATSTAGSTGSPQATTTKKVPSRETQTTSAKPVPATPVTYTPAPQPLHGLPDLSVAVTQIGYLESDSTDSFVASSSVPTGDRPAVKFTVKNLGTNVSGSWTFNAVIPARNSFTYYSPTQQSLNPGDSIDYTLGFDRAQAGSNQPITITVNPDNSIKESDTTNNSITVDITVL